MISFGGAQFPKSGILHAVFFYLRCRVSYRELEEILTERGVTDDHA
ncbi:MAG: IS6 family transposase, partial [Pseudomonadota bacterium]